MPMPQKPKIEKDTAERWLLTYADLMNLLLIFFIVLYAMSQVDVAKFNQLAQSLNMSLGNSSLAPYIDNAAAGGTALIPLPATAPSSVVPSKLEEQQIDELKKKVDAVIEKKGLKSEIDVVVQERGIVISINAQLLFKSGSSDLEANSKPTIGEIGQILLEVPGKQIKIEGHTDNDPIKSNIYPSNWELSSARATNVLRLLVDQTHVEPKTISAVGYGEYRPLVPNTTDVNKAKNRRVDIVILRDAFDKGESGISKPIVPPANAEDTKVAPAEQAAKKTTQTPRVNTTTVVKSTPKVEAPASKAPPAEVVKPVETPVVNPPAVVNTDPPHEVVQEPEPPVETITEEEPPADYEEDVDLTEEEPVEDTQE